VAASNFIVAEVLGPVTFGQMTFSPNNSKIPDVTLSKDDLIFLLLLG
jgi:hypothetical protein